MKKFKNGDTLHLELEPDQEIYITRKGDKVNIQRSYPIKNGEDDVYVEIENYTFNIK